MKELTKSINVSENTLCTGCMACMDICPTNAIQEGFTNDGFRVPQIQIEKCINCGKCESVCNINKEKLECQPIEVFRMFAKENNIRAKASSGGVFPLLAEKIIKSGGVVIGAAFNSKEKDICHVSSEEYSLDDILRSKYVQSNTIGIYNKVLGYLIAGRKVLFSGTPCQVRALNSFLKGKKYSGMIFTIDFMCHGVPATMQFKDFIDSRELAEKSPVVNVTFREKDLGWRKQVIKTYHKNNKIWRKTSSYYYYYYLFLNDYALRDSCYFCDEYKHHVSDLTLADDWISDDNDDLGTSLVFVNNKIGQELLNGILGNLIYDDKSSMVMGKIEIYSHKHYDYKKKEAWKEALIRGGFSKAKKIFFYKVSTIPIIHSKLRENISCFKGLVKKLLR